jgi:hypothetical protein
MARFKESDRPVYALLIAHLLHRPFSENLCGGYHASSHTQIRGTRTEPRTHKGVSIAIRSMGPQVTATASGQRSASLQFEQGNRVRVPFH